MKPIGQLNTSHAMYQKKPVKGQLSAYERRQNELALRTAASLQRNGIVPDPHGSQAQKEAWMRERQALKTARINGERESELLDMAHAEIRQRRLKEKSTIETEPSK